MPSLIASDTPALVLSVNVSAATKSSPSPFVTLTFTFTFLSEDDLLTIVALSDVSVYVRVAGVYFTLPIAATSVKAPPAVAFVYILLDVNAVTAPSVIVT